MAIRLSVQSCTNELRLEILGEDRPGHSTRNLLLRMLSDPHADARTIRLDPLRIDSVIPAMAEDELPRLGIAIAVREHRVRINIRRTDESWYPTMPRCC